MNETVADLFENYKVVAKECQTLTFLPRNVDLQKEAIKRADEFLGKAHKAQIEVIEENDEEAANQILAFRCLISSVRAELYMWVQLKRSNWNAAWHALVDAQEYADSAQAAHPISRKSLNVERLRDKLSLIEKFVFPPQVFNSPGIVVEEFSCSICGEDYEQCDHLAGIPYWGRFCSRIPEKIEESREVSVVDNPEDKKARITHFTTDDGMVRNRMTWKKFDPDELDMDFDADDDSMQITGVVMTPDNTDPIYELDEDEFESD